MATRFYNIIFLCLSSKQMMKILLAIPFENMFDTGTGAHVVNRVYAANFTTFKIIRLQECLQIRYHLFYPWQPVSF